MCYNTITLYQSTIMAMPTCFQCGSPLILVSKVTEKMANSLFPQTTSIYRCSNQICQEKTEKETATRIRLQHEKEEAAKERAEIKLKEKMNKLNQVRKKVY